MGGYAAVRAGLALKAHTVVAFSPQVFLDRAERALLELPPSAAFDEELGRTQAGCARRGASRLPCAIDALLFGDAGKQEGGKPDGGKPDPSSADVSGSAEVGGSAEGRGTRIEVHVGSRAAGDVREAMVLREAMARSGHESRCSVVVHPQCGHMLVGDLRNRGALDGLLHRVLGASEVPNVAA